MTEQVQAWQVIDNSWDYGLVLVAQGIQTVNPVRPGNVSVLLMLTSQNLATSPRKIGLDKYLG